MDHDHHQLVVELAEQHGRMVFTTAYRTRLSKKKRTQARLPNKTCLPACVRWRRS